MRMLLRVINDIQTSLPPLRGVIHSAMVLDDGILLQLTADRFRHVMRPKNIRGLEPAQRHETSPAGLLPPLFLGRDDGWQSGDRGAMLRPTCSSRRSHITGTSWAFPHFAIAWGHVNDVGYVARNAQVGAHLDSIGLKGYSAKLALGALGRVMGSSQAQVGIMKVDWHEWFQYAPGPRLITVSHS